jgi:hypothetical protein
VNSNNYCLNIYITKKPWEVRKKNHPLSPPNHSPHYIYKHIYKNGGITHSRNCGHCKNGWELEHGSKDSRMMMMILWVLSLFLLMGGTLRGSGSGSTLLTWYIATTITTTSTSSTTVVVHLYRDGSLGRNILFLNDTHFRGT